MDSVTFTTMTKGMMRLFTSFSDKSERIMQSFRLLVRRFALAIDKNGKVL